ncbi:MAG: outer membrane beta-barrel protein [Candidatus Zixiibacteriota bacterium]
MIKRLTIPIILVFCLVASSGFSQGVMDLLDRLEQVEKQLKSFETRIANAENQLKVEPAEKADLSIYDESLLELAARLTALERDLQYATEEQKTMYADINAQYSDISSKVSVTSIPQEETTPAPLESPIGISITGFVDGSYYYDASSASNSFGFDQVEVDIEKDINSIGSLRTDVEWVSDGSGGFALDVEQGYVTFSPKVLGPVSFTFGKFNAPIGFELLDAPDMYQYSHALVFNYGLPTNITGMMASADFGYGLDWSLYIVNGWDQNVDLNTGKTIGSRFGWNKDWGGIGFSFTYGADTEVEGDHQTVFDWDMVFTPMSFWTIGGEFNFGNNAVGDSNNRWWGMLIMNHWDFNGWFGLTNRFDYFDDKNASRLGFGVIEKRKAITFAPTFNLGEGMGALFEFRYDFSDQEVFEDNDGNLQKSAITAAYEMTYSF